METRSESDDVSELATVARLYDLVLACGEAGRERFYDALREGGIAPTPADEPGHLYAPNPVIVPESVVRQMAGDVVRFRELRRAEVRDGADLIALVPADAREVATPEIADRVHAELERIPPFACLDAYLVRQDGRLRPAYLEWQTFPGYPNLALTALAAIRRSFPGLEEAGARLLPDGGDLDGARAALRRLFLHGVADDPRRAVIVDVDPEHQVTRREFWETRRLTGGDRGAGVIDPRQVVYADGRAAYRCGAELVPIDVVFSRVVHDDLVQLLAATRGEQRAGILRFFRDPLLTWRIHPLHFHYGSKADFPGFRSAGASPCLPECRVVTDDLIANHRAAGLERVTGWVQKPLSGCGGRAIRPDPTVDELEPGALLQRRIEPAECHRTLAGDRVPEVRLMAVPDPDTGLLRPQALFARVKAPDEFCSNAGVTARANVAGTGEGYCIIASAAAPTRTS